jgi:transposase InsO family protein
VPVHPAPGDRRYERWLNGTFALLTALDLVTGWWRMDYNEQRPHSALGGIPPAEFIQHVVENVKTPHQPNFP